MPGSDSRPRASDGVRHEPKQRRSRELVAAILESTRQLIAEGGADRLTTNRVAERAGVSIGSLYRYFPNKEALVEAVLKRESQSEARSLGESEWEIDALPLPRAIEALVDYQLERHRRLLDQYGRFHREHHHATSLTRQMGARSVERHLRDLLERHSDALGARDLDEAAFLLSRGVSAIVRTAVEERPEKLDAPAFRRELVDLVQRYLGPERDVATVENGRAVRRLEPDDSALGS